MEELKLAINAMKQAEESLAMQGFTLRWKVRVKANQGFFQEMIKNLMAFPVTSARKPVLLRKTCKKTKSLTKPEQPKEEAQPAAQKPEEMVEEEQPVTALTIGGAAAYLGISTAGVYDLIKRGRIQTHGKMGSRWFKTEELDYYLEHKNQSEKKT